PFYLEWKAKEYDYHTKLIETSGIINDSMPEFVVENVMKLLNGHKKALNGAKVLVMGAAYKKDIDDMRESPTLKVLEILNKNGADIMINDPYIPSFKHKGIEYISVDWEKEIDNADIVIITTDHSCYDYELMVEKAKILYDTRNATKDVKKNRDKINKL
ncbi:UDP binding domain-containing protein, partial [Clostridium sp. UBA3887]